MRHPSKRPAGRLVVMSVIASLLLSSTYPTVANAEPNAISRLVMACAVMLGGMVGTTPAQDVKPAPAAIVVPGEKEKAAEKEKALADVRAEVEKPVTEARVRELEKELAAALVKAKETKATADNENALRNHTWSFVENVLKKPKFWFINLSLFTGLGTLYGLRRLWIAKVRAADRGRYGVSSAANPFDRASREKFIESLKTAGVPERTIEALVADREATNKALEALVLAENNVRLATRQLNDNDRAELLKMLDKDYTPTDEENALWLSTRADLLALVDNLSEGARLKLEGWLRSKLNEGAKNASATPLPTIDLQEAYGALELAYAEWQALATRYALALTASGYMRVEPPPALRIGGTEADNQMRALLGMGFSWDAVSKYMNQIDHLQQQVKKDLGIDVPLRRRMFRAARVPLLLFLLFPVVTNGILLTTDLQEVQDRRMQDLNTANLQDTTTAAESFIRDMTRKERFAVVQAWLDDPAMARYACPFFTNPREAAAGDGNMFKFEALLYQTMLEHGVGKKLDSKFYELFLTKVFADHPQLRELEQKDREKLIRDLAYKTARIWDSPILPVAPPPAMVDVPALGAPAKK